MLDLIKTYSVQEILTFLVILSLGIKGFISFYDWAKDRLKKAFKKETDQENEIWSIQDQINERKKEYEILKKSQYKLQENLNELITKVNLLIDSDKDDIKSFITERHHHFCYQKEWIDDYSLDCLEKRYKHYIDEGGNSFIEDLMNELKDLPKQPPK